MNNKSTMVASIVGTVIVASILGFVRKKREKEDAKMTEDRMNQNRDLLKENDFAINNKKLNNVIEFKRKES